MNQEKLYGIATKTNVCSGHGDYSDDLRICKMGYYGNDGFPPLFLTIEDAKNYISENRMYGVVPVELKIFKN